MLASALLATTLLSGGFVPASVQAQAKAPLRIVVGFAPGGPIDAGARALAPLLQSRLKRTVVVDNKPGAGGAIAAQAVLAAPADGNTVYMQTVSTISKVFVRDFPIDMLREMEPVAPIWTVSYFLFVNGSVPATSAKELAAYLRSKDGQLNYAAPTSSSMLTMEQFKTLAKADVLKIPYKGSAPSVMAMLANEVQLSMDVLEPYRAHLERKQIRPLLYTGKQRNTLFPDVPTAAQAGYPELEISLTGGFWMKRGAPAGDSDQLKAAIAEILAMPEFRDRARSIGWNLATGDANDLLQATLSEMGFWQRTAKQINFVPE